MECRLGCLYGDPSLETSVCNQLQQLPSAPAVQGLNKFFLDIAASRTKPFGRIPSCGNPLLRTCKKLSLQPWPWQAAPSLLCAPPDVRYTVHHLPEALFSNWLITVRPYVLMCKDMLVQADMEYLNRIPNLTTKSVH